MARDIESLLVRLWTIKYYNYTILLMPDLSLLYFTIIEVYWKRMTMLIVSPSGLYIFCA